MVISREQETSLDVKLSWDTDPAKVVGVETTLAEATVEIVENGSAPIIRMTVPPGKKQYPGSHRVTVKTDDPLVPEMRVPVTFTSRVPKNRRMARSRASGGSTGATTGKKKGNKAR